MDFDVGIIGGGPAGAATAAYLAKKGVKCVVLEREVFPRPHVGESLVPSSTRVFKELDFLEQMEAHRFPRKYGAVWTAKRSKAVYDLTWEGLTPDCHAAIRFGEREQPGVEQNYTYHVDRGQFDLALLRHANKLGADVYEGWRVSQVDFSDPGRVRIKASAKDKEINVSCRMVVDASGRQTLLGNQLGLKVMDPVFNQYAIHTWFEGYDRGFFDPSKKDYIYIHFLPVTNSWIWQIPITETITSIGVVTQKKHFAASKGSHEQFFQDCAATHPGIFENIKAAERLRPFKAEGDYSYAMKQICGDRFVLVGDAGRFVDPIFSTGVSIALNSARFASADILRALESGDFSRESFKNFETTIRRGTKNWYEFIKVYYRLNVLFTSFVMDKRYRLDVLKLLQGDVYDEEEPLVLKKMREMVAEVERDEDHVWHGLLGELTADAFNPVNFK